MVTLYPPLKLLPGNIQHPRVLFWSYRSYITGRELYDSGTFFEHEETHQRGEATEEDCESWETVEEDDRKEGGYGSLHVSTVSRVRQALG